MLEYQIMEHDSPMNLKWSATERSVGYLVSGFSLAFLEQVETDNNTRVSHLFEDVLFFFFRFFLNYHCCWSTRCVWNHGCAQWVSDEEFPVVVYVTMLEFFLPLSLRWAGNIRFIYQRCLISSVIIKTIRRTYSGKKLRSNCFTLRS